MIVLIDPGRLGIEMCGAGPARALVMGERSFGKGSVQTLLPLTRSALS
jgi:carboxyl-terminal processing protease